MVSKFETPMWSVGLMTGTVLDGHIDVALIRTDGESVYEFGPWALVPYPEDTVKLIKQAVVIAKAWNFKKGREPEVFAKAEMAITRGQSIAVEQLVTSAGLTLNDIGVIGFHGQTVLHRPPDSKRRGKSRQLGDGRLMAELLKSTVVYDFRSKDLAAGGQGAPISPIYHVALLKNSKLTTPVAVLNLGGVANLTYWDGDSEIIAFDTGPANAPINDWISQQTDKKIDEDGVIAQSGTADETILNKLISHPYFRQQYPKSLDRDHFTAAMVDGLDLEDGAATLTAFCASALNQALNQLPSRPEKIILCGGGRKNKTLVHEIKQRAQIEPIMSEDCGWRGDALEAECFAYLAMRSLRELPISFPTTTGVPNAMSGGIISNP